MLKACGRALSDELPGHCDGENGGDSLMTSKTEASERLLIEAAQKDPRRFADLYEANFERVYAFVVRRVRDRSEAEDLTAEVFHQALANLKNFEWRGAPFAAWLFRIASNAVADRWERLQREHGNPVSGDPPDPRGGTSPEEIEKRARLFRLVADLPADQRSVIEMRFVAGKSIAEIARQLGRSDGAVKQLQFRAIRALRTRWELKRQRQTSVKHG